MKPTPTLNELFPLVLEPTPDGGLSLTAKCATCGWEYRTWTPGGPPGECVEIPEEFRTWLLEHRATHERPS